METPSTVVSTSRGVKTHHIAYVLLAACGAFLLLLVYWLIWPTEVIRIKGFRIIEETVTPGKPLTYELDYCQNSGYERVVAAVQHTFINGVRHNLPAESGPIPDGCHIIQVSLVVPILPPGDYRLEMYRIYKATPLKNLMVSVRSNPFHVAPCCLLMQAAPPTTASPKMEYRPLGIPQ